MLEVEEDHLDQDEHENAAHEQERKGRDLQRIDGEHRGAQNRRAVALPPFGAGFELLEPRQPDRAPSHERSPGGAHDRP